MRDHNDNSIACSNAKNRASQRFIAVSMEIGVRFVENDEKRITIECPRKRNPLRLTGGKRCALFTNRRFVALRHADNEFMNAGGPGRGDYYFRLGFGRETSDIVGDSAR